MENKDFEMLFCLHGYVERDCPKCTSKPPMENKVQVSQEFVDAFKELFYLVKRLETLNETHKCNTECRNMCAQIVGIITRAEQAFAAHKDGSLGEGGNGGE